MLLRRITQHVKDQNWFAVALDFVIVVAGILIAFQITEWNEARIEAKLETEVLTAILDDINNDKGSLNTGLAFAQSNIDASNSIFQKAGLPVADILEMPFYDVPALGGYKYEVSSGPAEAISNTSQLWKNASVRYHPNQSDSAFSSLIAAGDLSVIKDDKLVRDLQKYSQLWEGLENAHLSTYRPFRNQLVFVGQKYGLSPFTEIDEAELITRFQENPELASALRTMLEYGVLHREQTEQVKRLAEDLAERLEGKIQ